MVSTHGRTDRRTDTEGYNIIPCHTLVAGYKKGKFNYWNQSSNGNFIHKDDVKFPNFSQNADYFPNSTGPGPIPKKGCESPVKKLGLLHLSVISSNFQKLCNFNECY